MKVAEGVVCCSPKFPRRIEFGIVPLDLREYLPDKLLFLFHSHYVCNNIQFAKVIPVI